MATLHDTYTLLLREWEKWGEVCFHLNFLNPEINLGFESDMVGCMIKGKGGSSFPELPKHRIVSMIVIGSHIWYNDDDTVGLYRTFAVLIFLKGHY